MGLKREPYGFLDAYFRYQRAGEHLTDLRQLIAEFKYRPQPVLSHIEAETLDELFRPDRPEVYPVEIPDKIPVRIGEIAYNLRCSLDYLVFALAWHDTGIEPSDEWARGLQFPVESNPKFAERGWATMLKGLSDPHVAMIREYQPRNGCHWTGVLADLNDSDKHRYLTVLAGTFDPDKDTAWFVTNAAEIEAQWGRGILGSTDEMEMEFRATFDVVFPDGRLVAESLEELESEVGALLLRFGAEFVLKPL